jgi:hypothetical protein
MESCFHPTCVKIRDSLTEGLARIVAQPWRECLDEPIIAIEERAQVTFYEPPGGLSCSGDRLYLCHYLNHIQSSRRLERATHRTDVVDPPIDAGLQNDRQFPQTCPRSSRGHAEQVSKSTKSGRRKKRLQQLKEVWNASASTTARSSFTAAKP